MYETKKDDKQPQQHQKDTQPNSGSTIDYALSEYCKKSKAKIVL